MGTIFMPEENRGREVFVDASFLQDWDLEVAWEDPDIARSRHGFAILYAGCTTVSKSQLQSEICLSATEAEYVGISFVGVILSFPSRLYCCPVVLGLRLESRLRVVEISCS
jgi:hypothetical protein